MPRKRDPLLPLVLAAQRQTPTPNSPKAVGHILLTRMWEDLVSDEGSHHRLVADGLNHRLRRLMKQGGDEDEAGVTTRQLEMFAPGLRGLVARIDRARVYVPSLDEFVALDPHSITPDQMHEAGEHLIGKGKETMKRGELVVSLAAQLQADVA